MDSINTIDTGLISNVIYFLVRDAEEWGGSSSSIWDDEIAELNKIIEIVDGTH